MTTVSLVDDALPLEGLDVDVPLPYGDALDVADVLATDPVTLVEELAGTLSTTRRALAEALAHVEAGTIPGGARVRAWRELAGTAYVDGMTPEERKVDGIARASAKWSPEESARVDAAIATVAAQVRHDARTRKVGDGLEEFTTADVWAELGPGFPVTKGIAGRMSAARAAGLIRSTGRTIIIPANAAGPNHGQRLTVWTTA